MKIVKFLEKMWEFICNTLVFLSIFFYASFICFSVGFILFMLFFPIGTIGEGIVITFFVLLLFIALIITIIHQNKKLVDKIKEWSKRLKEAIIRNIANKQEKI